MKLEYLDSWLPSFFGTRTRGLQLPKPHDTMMLCFYLCYSAFLLFYFILNVYHYYSVGMTFYLILKASNLIPKTIALRLPL
ncbi:hypothetical protein ACFX1X_022756 [Malus domestica]